MGQQSHGYRHCAQRGGECCSRPLCCSQVVCVIKTTKSKKHNEQTRTRAKTRAEQGRAGQGRAEQCRAPGGLQHRPVIENTIHVVLSGKDFRRQEGKQGDRLVDGKDVEDDWGWIAQVFRATLICRCIKYIIRGYNLATWMATATVTVTARARATATAFEYRAPCTVCFVAANKVNAEVCRSVSQ